MSFYSNNIDIECIDTHEVASFIGYNLIDYLTDKLSHELGTIQGYISKYDNDSSRLNGTSVIELIKARNEVLEKLARIRALSDIIEGLAPLP